MQREAKSLQQDNEQLQAQQRLLQNSNCGIRRKVIAVAVFEFATHSYVNNR
jgi:hypothetical protein